MSTRYGESAIRPQPDKVVQDIADYAHNYKVDSDLAWETARLCLINTIGCGLEGLRFPEYRNLLGPVVEGTIVPNGCVPPIRLSCQAHTDFTTQEPRSAS
jgi:2-methylcitrate dehydratase